MLLTVPVKENGLGFVTDVLNCKGVGLTGGVCAEYTGNHGFDCVGCHCTWYWIDLGLHWELAYAVWSWWLGVASKVVRISRAISSLGQSRDELKLASPAEWILGTELASDDWALLDWSVVAPVRIFLVAIEVAEALVVCLEADAELVEFVECWRLKEWKG